MVNGDLIKVGIYTFGFGVFVLWQGFRLLKKKRLMENIPTSTIRSIAMGLVEVKGKVSSTKELFKSPFTKKDCVYYDFEIEERVSSGKHSRWVTVSSGRDGDYFYLQDDTGTVLVENKGAEIDIEPSMQFTSWWGRDPPQQVIEYLDDNKIQWESFLGANKTMRYTEHIITPGQQLYVMGTAVDNPFVEEASAQKGHEDVMIKKGKHEKQFYISDKSEKKLTGSYAWKSPLMIFGGGALIVGGLAIIIVFAAL